MIVSKAQFCLRSHFKCAPINILIFYIKVKNEKFFYENRETGYNKAI